MNEMMTTSIFQPIEIGVETMSKQTEEEKWTLSQYSDLHGFRSVSKKIKFDKVHRHIDIEKTKIAVGLSGVTFMSGSSDRIRTEVKSIEADGFTVEVSTWYDTCIEKVSLNWIAQIENNIL